jgi:hypothetical protein
MTNKKHTKKRRHHKRGGGETMKGRWATRMKWWALGKANESQGRLKYLNRTEKACNEFFDYKNDYDIKKQNNNVTWNDYLKYRGYKTDCTGNLKQFNSHPDMKGHTKYTLGDMEKSYDIHSRRPSRYLYYPNPNPGVQEEVVRHSPPKSHSQSRKSHSQIQARKSHSQSQTRKSNRSIVANDDYDLIKDDTKIYESTYGSKNLPPELSNMKRVSFEPSRTRKMYTETLGKSRGRKTSVRLSPIAEG